VSNGARFSSNVGNRVVLCSMHPIRPPVFALAQPFRRNLESIQIHQIASGINLMYLKALVLLAAFLLQC
jgi:hypothetical protein